MTKYSIEGLDCPACANDLECELRKDPALAETRLSFATGALYLDERHEARAREIIAGVEPGVSIRVAEQGSGRAAAQPAASTSPGLNPPTPAPLASAEASASVKAAASAEGGAFRRNLLRIGAAALLLLLGIVYDGALRATPYAAAEYLVFLAAYLLVGGPVLASAFRSIRRGRVFDEMFLMSVATLGAIAIHQLPEAVGVMLFYAVGEHLQERAVARSRRSISSLMRLRPEAVRLLEEGGQRLAAPETVAVGSRIEVLPGERIPLDGLVLEGSSSVNTSSLTGESLPRRVEAGDPVLGGFVNEESRLVLRVDKEFGKTAVARILELVEEAASHKAPTEKFISRFAAVYTPFVVVLAALIAFLPPLLFGASLSAWVYRALVILVISCPCALVISIPLGYFGGIGAASRRKLLVKGANHLDSLTRVDTLVFDKTGTLTEGVFAVKETVTRNGFGEAELLAWAAAAESHSPHPIARSIREAAERKAGLAAELAAEAATSEIVEVRGQGVLARVGGHRLVVGNDRLLHREGIVHGDCELEGTVVYVAVDGSYAGYLRIADRVKPGAREAVAELRRLGVRRLLMLTGDERSVAARVAEELGLDGYYAELLPDAKVERLEALERDPERRGALVFVGDGMNDAPVLMRADVGVAMGGLGSDAAIEAADLVVMDDRLERLPEALRIAAFTRRVVLQNIALALLVKGAFIALGSLGLANMWEAVIGDVGVSLLAVLNALRTSRRGLSKTAAD